MRFIHHQAETARRSRFNYDPSRHYVLVQKAEGAWDGPQLERLLDEVDENGQDAYVEEANGASGAEARRITGHRNLVMLSCTKAHIDAKIRKAVLESNAQAMHIEPSKDFEDKLEHRSAIGLRDIPSKH